MANNVSQSSCLSGAVPIKISSKAHCNPGFFCPNISDAHPPEFCQPTTSCQALRLQFPNSICPESQGIFQPTVCPPGSFCPKDDRNLHPCPARSYCPPGTFRPIQCGPASICPVGSSREFPLIGFVIILIVDLALGLLWYRDHRSRRKRDHRKDTEQGLATRFSSSEGNSSSEQLSSENYNPYIRSFTASIASCLGTGITGLEFIYSDLSYHPRGSQHEILSASHGIIAKGTFSAIMGPSGAGKSTFVNLLMGIKRPSSGHILVNGHQVDTKKWRQLVGFVPQADVILPELTVRENLIHAARVRLPPFWTSQDRERHIALLIRCLGLTDAQDRVIYNVSGGERKRASIGIELAGGSMALFLDEPTSGLDAASALSLIKLLKILSEVGITVVCVIHQPRKEIFEIFDHTVVLHQGKQVYTGPSSGMVPFFKSLGYMIPDTTNPADSIIDIVTGSNSVSNGSQGVKDHATSLAKLWDDEWKRTHPTSVTHQPVVGDIELGQELIPIIKRASWQIQTYLNFRRALKQQQRQPVSFFLEISVGAIAGLLIGLALYPYKGVHFQGMYQPPFELLSTTVDYKTIPMISLMCSMAIGLAAAAPAVRVLGDEKDVYRRETHSGYSPSAYYVGKVLATLPRVILSALHFTSFYVILATPSIPFWENYATILVYFYAIYGLSSCVSVTVAKEDGPLFATILCLIISVLDGHGPPLATVREWHLEWLWRMCPGTWFTEAYMDRFIVPTGHLYNTAKAAEATKFTLGRFALDLSMIFIIGCIYRAIAFVGLACMRERC